MPYPKTKTSAFYFLRGRRVPFAFDSASGVIPLKGDEGEAAMSPLGMKLVAHLSGKLSPADLQGVLDIVTAPGAMDGLNIPEAEAKPSDFRFQSAGEDDLKVTASTSPKIPGMDRAARSDFASRYPHGHTIREV